jgi:hypothetical protein
VKALKLSEVRYEIQFCSLPAHHLLAGLFVLGFTTLSAPKYADAQPISKAGHEIDYYSDATHRTQVGIVIFCKNGQTFRSGQVTEFSIVEPSGY